jgi:hypothetical protein
VTLRLVTDRDILSRFAAQLAARCGESWAMLSEPARDYYREISRTALMDAGAKLNPGAGPPAENEP